MVGPGISLKRGSARLGLRDTGTVAHMAPEERHLTLTMRTLLNIIWLFLGGIWLGLGYLVAGVVAIVGLMILGFFVIDWTTPGPLRDLVRSGRPNAAAVAASGVVSMAFIVVLAI